VHVAQVDFRGGIRPVSRILQLESHLAHIGGNILVANWLSVDEGLLYNNLELTITVSSKTDYKKPCLWKISIMERDTVKGKDGLYEIVQAY